MANEAEIRLRDRLSKLSGLDLLRGARLSGELERLKRQLDRIDDIAHRLGHLGAAVA